MSEMDSRSTAPQQASVFDVLRSVIDPELGSNVVELGMVQQVEVTDDGVVTVKIGLTSAGCPLRGQIQRDAKATIETLEGVRAVNIEWGELSPEARASVMDIARKNAADKAADSSIPASARVLAISSGKGGVGKSSVTVNLAAALADQGYKVGIIDADIWGFSIPRMLGLEGRLEAIAEPQKATIEPDGATPVEISGAAGKPNQGRPSIKPMQLDVGSGRIDVVSMGFLVDNEEAALLWRGLMLNRAVQHFCEDVRWDDDLNYVLVDMPPGTGDVAMGLARMLSRAEMIVVTTPALGARKVAARAVSMARRCHLRVAGVIENMSCFVAPDGVEHHVFGRGGGETLARESGVPLIGSVPIEAMVSDGGDQGRPLVLDTETAPSAAAQEFRRIASIVSTEIAPPVSLDGCSARTLDLPDDGAKLNEFSKLVDKQ